MVRFVERDGQNKVVGTFARPQPGRAEEVLPDDHFDIVDFNNRSVPKPSQLGDIPASVNSVPALRNAVNNVLAFLRGD